MKKHIVYFFVIVIAMIAGTVCAFAGGISGKVTAHGAKNGENAVIYIAKISGKSFPAPQKHDVMNQKNLMFQPHVLPVLAGTTVDFLNSDKVLHNVYCPDACAG